MTSHISDNENRSVKLIGKFFATEESSKEHSANWRKNGEKIDSQAGGRVYIKMSDNNTSLIIQNVNKQDAGSYRFTAISSAGSTESEIVLGSIIVYEYFSFLYYL